MKMPNELRGIWAALLAFLLPFSTLSPCFAKGAEIAHVSVGRDAAALFTKFSGTGSGTLGAVDSRGHVYGQCPLKHTDVSAKISGYLANVTVTQEFQNPFKTPIEAVYTFPLSTTGTVNEMVMKVGDRVIHGIIKKREEARAIYESAKARGQTAALLDQERPNIFTQSVANIKPGHTIEITLHYVDVLPYEEGSFTFAFPTVVGPRYNPGSPTGKQGTGWSPDTTEVGDASRITPPVVPEGTRAGHDISLKVTINAGIPIGAISSKLHEVTINRNSTDGAEISLKDKATIPNRDFVLSWQVASDKLQSGCLTHRDGKYGYFLLMLIPPKKVTPQSAAPKEMIFIVDRSGSQMGLPIEKAKDTMKYILDNMNPRDTFQVISFSSQTEKLFAKPEMANPEMVQKAKAYISKLQGDGGTEMKDAVEEACREPEPEHRLRIITMMTDGYIGNDFEILGLVKKLRGNSRWFPFGTGNSVNRFLIDNIANEGGGEPDYVLLNDPAEAVAKKFYNRISSPVLTDVKVDFQGVEVKDVNPHTVSDVWAQRPLFITGRYEQPGTGSVTLRGYAQGKPYEQKLSITLPEKETDNAVLGTIWARAQIDRLMSSDLLGAQQGAIKKELKDEVIRIALEHHIVTQYTSFVAVDETPGSKENGKPLQVTVPVNMPDGVSYEKIFPNSRKGYAHHYQAGALLSRPSATGSPGEAAPMPAQFFGGFSQNKMECRKAQLECKPMARAVRQITDIEFVSGAGDAKAKKPDANLHLQLKDADAGSNRPKNDKLAISPEELKRLPRVDGNRIRVRLKMHDLSTQTLDKLKALGFKLLSTKRDSRTLIGTIECSKLSDLAKLSNVDLIEADKSGDLPSRALPTVIQSPLPAGVH
jgi:Ca-activated chloride channel family protein